MLNGGAEKSVKYAERKKTTKMSKYPIGFEVIDNAIKDCESIIEYAEYQGFDRSVIGINLVPSESRTSSTCYIPIHNFDNPPEVYNMNKRVYDEVGAYAAAYGVELTQIEDASIQRYEPGQHYDSHVDAGPGQPRVISALVYLNDTDGGETHFNNFEFSIEPKEGRLVIFPSNFIYRHEALPPNSGVKYAAAYWIQG